MAAEDPAHKEHDSGISSCRLRCLVKRTQVDFEIDFFEQVLSRNPSFVDALKVLGERLSEKGCHRRALQVDQRLAQLLPYDPVVAYNLACSYAALKRLPESLQWLETALRNGYDDIEYLLEDSDLEPLHSHEGFHKLLVGLLEEEALTRLV